MYVDDTLIIYKDNGINKAKEKARSVFQNMMTWCEGNKLSINVYKFSKL